MKQPAASRDSAPIHIEGLSKTYRSLWPNKPQVDALKEVDLEVGTGEMVALVGSNGAGKSTLFGALLGLVRPTAGQARLLGRDLQPHDPEVLAQVGWVSDDQDLPGWNSLTGLARLLRPLYPTWDDALYQRLVDGFELDPKRRLRTLSRGQRMRARLVLALAYRPRVLLMDEPFAGLDPRVRRDVIDGMLEMTQSETWTVLFASHEMHLVERLADRVAYLDTGRLRAAEPIDDLLSRFRKVSMRLDDGHPLADPAVRRDLPATWLDVRWQRGTLSFVDSAHVPSAGDEPLRAGFGEHIEGIRRIDQVPMSLEEIFLVLRRSVDAQEPNTTSFETISDQTSGLEKAS